MNERKDLGGHRTNRSRDQRKRRPDVDPARKFKSLLPAHTENGLPRPCLALSYPGRRAGWHYFSPSHLDPNLNSKALLTPFLTLALV